MIGLASGVARLGLVGLVVLMTAGCFGGSPPAPVQPEAATPTTTPTPGPREALPTRLLTPEPTVGPSPTATIPPAAGPGDNFDSPLYNYSVVVPKGWQVGPGAGKIGNVAADVFTGPEVDGFRTNVNVIAQVLPSGITDTPGFFRANVGGLQAIRTQIGVAGSVPVDSSRATMITYTQPRPGGDGSYRVYQVAFVGANKGWIVTLSCSERIAPSALQDFKTMLASFKPH